MARYLTPSKVGLLVLVVLYASEEVPTSESIAVLDFIITYISPKARSAKRGSDDNLHDHARAVDVRSIPEASLGDRLRTFARRSYGGATNIAAQIESQIVHEREVGIAAEEQTARIIRTSPLGAFIRRCHLEYTRMQFQDATALWQQLIVYRAQSRQQYERRNPPSQSHPLDSNLTAFGIDASHDLVRIMYGQTLSSTGKAELYSLYDVKALLEFQVSEMQSSGSRMPEDMRQKLTEMSEDGSTLPLTHYLTFLDSWRAGDYTSAFDNLHRYFDYTMQSRDRSFYQYALLNLAILQADFGCASEAIPAMQEAIATARENKDTTCLNFCMSWLYHFGRTFPSDMKVIQDSGILGNETEGLAFLKSRAKDAEMWSLLSTSLLSEAKLGLQHGSTLLIRASAFSRLGLGSLAWSNSETFLSCCAPHAPVEDVLKCICRVAGFLAQRGRYSAVTETLQSVPKATLRILKYQNYLQFYSSLLKLRLLIRHNDLDTARRIATQLQGQDPPDIENSFFLAFSQIELSMAEGNLSKALEIVEETAQRAVSNNNDIIVYTRLLNLKARILAASNNALSLFSIVVRAAQLAYRSLCLPALWEAIGLLANLLNVLGEHNAALELLNAIVPRVLECHDCELAAITYRYLVDAEIGLAGLEKSNKTRRKEWVNRAVDHLDSAGKMYGFAEDMKGQLEVLYRKSMIMKWQGDLVLANDVASKYLEVKKKFGEMRV
ncbi:Anaphase-promoting complex subunit 5 [Cyphellophora attinorum]|uniref:Anaphase-promoting complex subunit 5 n=1 Tax=Cyphellophora attinorum TaxID=1664694 RepID=A0A0N1H8S2_9EURO|nr:Anaphase-promoting complex subunit 5 [Phialophora attinorum]KPI43564.1 Anaphase-promoting complex subunit 5 [Phialophora attinorum]